MIGYIYLAIETFPKDDVPRVVCWYTGICKDTITNPETYVLIRKIIDGVIDLRSTEIIRVPIRVLDECRIASIWQNQERIYKCLDEIRIGNNSFNEIVEKSFEINFSQEEDGTISELEKNIDNSVYSFIFGDTSKPYNEINKSKIVSMSATNGVNIHIPSLEVLTSMICPKDKTLRTKLLQMSIDDILKEYLLYYKRSHKGYHIKLKERKRHSNLVLLAYLALNPETKRKISNIYSYLVRSEEYTFDPVMVGILPYHPQKVELRVRGIEYDSDFLVLQVAGCSLPSEKDIYHEDTLYASKGKFQNEKPFGAIKNSEIKENLPITNDNPGMNAGTVYMANEVSNNIGKPVNIIRNIKLVESENNQPRKPLKENEALGVGTGDESNDKASENLAKLRDSEACEDETNLETFYKTLQDTVDGEEILSVCCINKDGKSSLDFKAIDFPTTNHGKKVHWAIRNGRARKFILAKVEYVNNRSAYILEIEKTGEESSLYTLLFNFKEHVFNTKELYELVFFIIRNRGSYTKREGRTNVFRRVPLYKYLLISHKKINGSYKLKLVRDIKKGIDKDIFI
ncbi:hypothetical protein [Francisella philomiragia]|uniref:hypothetical protein n=1 Tax=Francisella philomiragia TaxID=28110 RepID=UPI001904785C|nr:hypothetical protein [Francisella philomiragia]MBK2267225.1 hypothetical protein [Francisella philomiragia]MBK2278762.1 hypothetical protein [Francisella philomiragia]